MQRILKVCAFLFVGMLCAAACAGPVQPTESGEAMPTMTMTPTAVPDTPTVVSPLAVPDPPTVASPIVTPNRPTPTPEPPGGNLPLPLYFLADQSIWLLEPGDTLVERITPMERDITSFDIWPGDGRIAYGTLGGQLYVMMPDQEPRLLHDVSAETNYATTVRSVSWSPDGMRLAYAVVYDDQLAFREAGYPSYPSGLWLLDIEDATPTWLLSNRYLNSEESDVNLIRIIVDPVWSPDGTALILTGSYWEWRDILLLDPIAPDLDEANLHDAPGDSWSRGTWASDSQSMLLSGVQNASYGDLVQVERASLESGQLIDGHSERIWVTDAQELPSGIVFLGSGDDGETRLYLGQRNENGFEYSPTGPERLCDALSPGHVEWDSTGRWGVFECEFGSIPPDLEQNEVHVITLDGENIDITPYLSPLANAERFKALWGK